MSEISSVSLKGFETVERTETSQHNSELLADLHELLSIFKFDLADHEVESVQRFSSKLEALEEALLPEQISALDEAMSYAVETQDTHVMTAFLKYFSKPYSSVESCLTGLKLWRAAQVALN